MADIFNFFVYDDRSIQFELAEPIMLEDKNVTQFRFRIPKSINGFDMTTWAWWFVYVNASRQKYSVPLVFTDDEDEPDEYANATYTVDYGMSGTAGTISFALEAINADATTSEILNEWHTKTYTTKVLTTLQGNETEFTPSEFDIISAKLEEILELIEGGVGGGTSDDIENKSTVSGATVTDALDSLSDEIANKQSALTFDSTPTAGSTNPVTSDGIDTALADLQISLSGMMTYYQYARLVTSISSSSDNVHYPSAKCVYDAVSAKEDETTIVTKTASDTSQTLAENTFYVWPEMTSLTITCPSTGGPYAFRFTSGSTATTLTMSGITMPDDFTVEANKVYEINVYQGYGLAASWAVS